MKIRNKINAVLNRNTTAPTQSHLEFLKTKFGDLDVQKDFEELLWIALRGLNIGTGDMFEDSGEIPLLHRIKDSLSKQNIKTPWIIFDVGANTGDYALEIDKVFSKDEAIVHVFEPADKTFKIVSNNLKEKDNFILVNKGISSSESKQKLYTDEDGSGMASLAKRNLEYRNISMDKVEEVELTTIDNYCEENNINHIHFLKLDIEGFELEALRGAEKILGNLQVDFIQFEFGGCNIDTRTYFKDFFFLLNEGYSIYRVLQNDIIEIPNYHEVHEQFNTTNYLAIRKELV